MKTDLEAQRMVLSLAMDDDDFRMEMFFRTTLDHFVGMAHKSIYLALEELEEGGVTPTEAELSVILMNRTEDEDRGELSEVCSITTFGENADFWLRRVEQAHSLRLFEQALRHVAQMVEREEPEEKITDAIETILQKVGAGKVAQLIYEPAQYVEEALDKLAEVYDNPSTEQGLNLGIPALNKITTGSQPGELIILAADSGKGKSTLALQMAAHVGITKNTPTLYCNTEMSKAQLTNRLISQRTGVPYWNIRTGRMSEEEWGRVSMESGIISVGHLMLTDAMPEINFAQIQGLARRYHRSHGIQFLVLDYIGRLSDMYEDKTKKEWQILERLAKQLKYLAQTLQIVVLCVAQLNYAGELAGSKRMRNECDLFLRMEPVDEEQMSSVNPFETNMFLRVDKNRDGEDGKRIPLYWHKEAMKMQEVARRGR